MQLSKMSSASTSRYLRVGLFAIAGLVLLATNAASAQTVVPPGSSTPPSLSYNPAANSTINFTGVGLAGSSGSASITVTPSGGVGPGPGATTTISCSYTGPNMANFSVMPSGHSFTPTSGPQSLSLSCTSGSTVRNATLTCTETPGFGSPTSRNWPVVCPAGTAPPMPPTLSYQPAPGQAVVFTPANAVVGGTTSASILITPSGGSGTGAAATTTLGSCNVTGESVPGTFSGFQGVNFSFVGATTTQRILALDAIVRATAVTGTLTCQEIQGGGGQTGSSATRSWPLQSPAGRPPSGRLSISKSASAPTVQANSSFIYTIDVANIASDSSGNSGAQTGLVVLDEVPQALTVVSATGAGWNCSVVGNSVDCRRTTLAANASSSIEIQVQAPANAQTLVNTARATSIESRTPVTSSVSVVITSEPVIPPPTVDLRLDKRDSADPVIVNAPFTYFLDVSNVGSNIASGVVVTDTLPSGVTLVSAQGPGWVCSGTATVTCSLSGSLISGALSTVSIQVRAPAQAATLSNQARVSTTAGNDVNPANDSDTETTVIQADPTPPVPMADLTLSAAVAPAAALTGQTVEFQLTARNLGPSVANNAQITATLAASLQIAGASTFQTDGWACTSTAPDRVSCSRATFVASATSTLRIPVSIRAGATAPGTLTAVISSATLDPIAGNNSASATVSFQSGGSNMSITKTDSVDPVRAGATFFYTLSIANAGPEAATGVRVVDTLPAPLTFVSASGAGFTCTNAAQVVTCNFSGSLAVGASASVQLNVRAPTTGQSVNNEAVVSSTTTDTNQANNRATQATQISNRTADDLATLLDSAAIDPASRAALPVVAAECALTNSALASTCREIIRAADDGRTGEVTEALRAIAPDEVLAQSTVLREIGATQFFNVDARLNELRRGGGGFSMSGLTVQSGTQSIPLALVGDAMQAALGFGESDGFGGLVSPWGFFINGNIGDGQQDIDFARGKVGVDYQSRGITAGVDYRFNPRFVAGAAIGYANFEADVAAGSRLDSKSLMFTGYGSYYLSDRFYVDTRLTYGQVQMDQERLIRFRLGSNVFDALAVGDTDATQLTVASSMGYHLNYGAWSVTPNAGVRFTNSDVDAFSESGANEYNVAYNSQSYSTVNVAVGVQVARAVSLSRGVLMPQFDLSLNNESGDDPSAEARLISGGVTELFRLTEESPDSSYATAGLGFVYLMGNGRQAFLSYRRMFGNEDMDRGSLNLGGRFEF